MRVFGAVKISCHPERVKNRCEAVALSRILAATCPAVMLALGWDGSCRASLGLDGSGFVPTSSWWLMGLFLRGCRIWRVHLVRRRGQGGCWRRLELCRDLFQPVPPS